MSIDRINPGGGKGPSDPLPRIEQTPEQDPAADTKGAFDRAMTQKSSPANPSSAANNAQGTSPLDLAKAGRGQAPIKADAHTVTNSLQQATSLANHVQEQVKTAKPSTLNHAQQNLLSQKLAAANTDLKGASTKLGLNTENLPAPTTGKGPVAKWLSLLSNGQQMMREAQQKLPSMIKSGHMDPGTYLALQMKMSSAMVNLDFASQILGKGGDALNKLMNVNI